MLSNLVGFASVLEGCRQQPPKHLVYASSSSVYGRGAKSPFREDDNTDQPTSFYGATKKSNELLAHSYARTHGLNITGLRFFANRLGFNSFRQSNLRRSPSAALQRGQESARYQLYRRSSLTEVITNAASTSSSLPARPCLQSRPQSTGGITLSFACMLLEQMLGKTAQLEPPAASNRRHGRDLRGPHPGAGGGGLLA